MSRYSLKLIFGLTSLETFLVNRCSIRSKSESVMTDALLISDLEKQHFILIGLNT